MQPRPKFCVGEEVGVDTVQQPFIPRTEVTEVVWREDQKFGIFNITYTGWCYRVAGQRNPKNLAIERQLKKLPPEERTQWKDCAWQPNKDLVGA